ncbi:hypothetical protein H5410_043217 [Solanum commersonii]|uniref:Uncharacterized protein n=1 Tax=Solanum commersonii TaxID=4109 RepID=A0A9J5XYK8_SOLCO|nr:hypothetical protein H5410_043217 [Solanum commersonii]
MDSGDGSISRWFCRNCKCPITKKGYTACECGCKTWVDDGTHEKWRDYNITQLYIFSSKYT